eukprot:scaffold31772_cov92-Cyclotella_meneghiniana.AAC.3
MELYWEKQKGWELEACICNCWPPLKPELVDERNVPWDDVVKDWNIVSNRDTRLQTYHQARGIVKHSCKVQNISHEDSIKLNCWTSEAATMNPMMLKPVFSLTFMRLYSAHQFTSRIEDGNCTAGFGADEP